MHAKHTLPSLSLADRQKWRQCEIELGDLAASWRSKKNTPAESDILTNYHRILNTMIAQGFRESLDVDTELPNELMPSAYLDLFR